MPQAFEKYWFNWHDHDIKFWLWFMNNEIIWKNYHKTLLGQSFEVPNTQTGLVAIITWQGHYGNPYNDNPYNT